MQHPILESTWLAPQIKRFLVFAPRVVRHAAPGQFVIIRVSPGGERIPLTIANSDRAAGTITLIVQAVGATTMRMCRLESGAALADVVGPLGKPTEIHHVGHAAIVGGGVGTAVIFPQAAALKSAGNRVSAVIGARSKSCIILEEELSAVCDAVLPCTDDGSYGFHGFVTRRLGRLLDDADAAGDAVREILCAGPVPMMRAVADLTRPRGVRTIASLNPIMVDGTGMCGGCRVHVAGETRFACVDGPEFDAHAVDFDELADRLTAYRGQEKSAMQRLENKQHVCQPHPR
jgi:ferredoxin/flavodoxin---NADP+ reductase